MINVSIFNKIIKNIIVLLVYTGYCTQYISLCMEKVLEEDEGLKTIMEQVLNFNVTEE